MKFPGFFCWRAIYQNACKGLHECTENCWSSFQGVDLECQLPLGVFLQDKIIFDLFGKGDVEHIKQKISCFCVFLEKGHLSLIFHRGKKYHVFGKTIPRSQIVQERSYPSAILFEKTIFSEHLKKIYFHVIFLRKIIFHFPSGGKIIFLGKRNIIFPNNTRKIIFQRNFFGKTIFSGGLEKENMVFRAVKQYAIILQQKQKEISLQFIFFVLLVSPLKRLSGKDHQDLVKYLPVFYIE